MRPAPGPADADARRRIRTSLDESLIVEASAGTGKTTELVRRIVAVLGSGRARIENIAAVTFTNKAAGEMKLRLREELDAQRQTSEGESRAALENALEHLEEASIGTIHSFCAQILRERPVEARVDPAFEELSEPEAARLYQKAFRAWLERQLEADSPGLRRAFARLAWRDSWDDSPAVEQLQWAGWKLVEWRDYPAAWRREPFSRVEEIDTLIRMVSELAALSSRPRRVNDALYLALAPARALSTWIEKSGTRDYDSLESLLLKLARDLARETRKGSGDYGGGVVREDLISQRNELVRWLEEFKIRADADLAALLRQEMTGLLEEYRERKYRLGKLDFVDLLCSVRDLIRDQAHVREYLQQRFTHLFIDEFQDTDPLQVEILILLSAGDPLESEWEKVTPAPGKLFVVGDPKQSIYKFRRADLVLYQQVREALQSRGVGLVSLTQSFRSVPNIQQLVNAAFEPEMSGAADAGHAPWAALEPYREPLEDRPSVIALPVPKPYKTRLAKEAVNQCLPDAIAAFISWVLSQKQWDYQARDVAVLFRRRTQNGTDLTREYARALEARGIPHLLAGSKSFHRREEIETMRSALTAIEWPDDELSVFATLKGSLFAIPDETLFLYRHRHGRLNPFRKHASEHEAIEAALDLIADLHRKRNHRPFAATVNSLLDATRAQAGFLLRPGGQQILANVARIPELARRFETSGGLSFRGFVDELTAQAERENAAEAPVLEEDSDGVRLMTVHGVKGLEFKVVILADATAALSAREPDQFVDPKLGLSAMRLLRCAPWELREHAAAEAARERAEGIRVAYVAATRARDILVVPAVGDEPFPTDGWLTPLHKAIYPARANWRNSRPAPHCPDFGHSSVISRPADYDHNEEFSVRPGLVEPETGTHEVVWWDPWKLKLGEELSQALWQNDVLKQLLAEDGGASLSLYTSWKAERESLLRTGAKPQLDIFLPSQAMEPPPGPPISVAYSTALQSVRRVGGKRFGVLVHAILREVPLDADAATIGKFARLNARILGAPPAEAEAGRAAVEAALAHPVLERARTSKRCHREYPITLRWGDNRLLEGVIDLAYLDHDRWMVVDFKTDADTPDRRSRYERQLQWYAHALTELTGIPAQGHLLGV